MGSEDRPPLILNLDTRWREVINFTTRPLYPRETPLVPTQHEAGGLQNGSGRLGEEKNLLPLPGFEPQKAQPLSSRNTEYPVPFPLCLGFHLIFILFEIN